MPIILAAAANSVNPSVLAFKPRQLLLSKPEMEQSRSSKISDGDTKALTLKPDQKVLLLHYVAKYLERSGFLKTLKKFQSEAKIEKDLAGTNLDLEQIFSTYLEMSDHAPKPKNAENRTVEKSKEKKKKKSDSALPAEQGSKLEAKEAGDKLVPDEREKKPKDKKKKSKSGSKLVSDDPDDQPVESISLATEDNREVMPSDNKKVTGCEIEEKPRDKIKKKSKPRTDTLPDNAEHNDQEKKQDKGVAKVENLNEVYANGVSLDKDIEKPKGKKRKKDEQEISEDSEVDEVSKKRKRLDNEEDGYESGDTEADKSKRKKKERHKDASKSEKTPEKQPGDQMNGKLEKMEAKSTAQKSTKKQNTSKEPKKPFQRVNVEEIVFVDEKLHDNSYWAKDGADSGYGAKAQEILGQVRGRDFRHEKTKKKRGSYRGGQIDLQSHSVKFNYSDEE